MLAELAAIVAGGMGKIAVGTYSLLISHSHPKQYQSAASRDPPVSVSFDRPLDYRLGL